MTEQKKRLSHRPSPHPSAPLPRRLRRRGGGGGARGGEEEVDHSHVGEEGSKGGVGAAGAETPARDRGA